jgi:peptidoglycan/LPS O-acetylase OafA/YrhL
VVLGWLLPALVLTLLSLALTPRLGPVTAAAVVGLGWVVLLVCTVRFDTGQSMLFGPTGQVTFAIGAAVAAVAVLKARPGFETGRHLNHTPRFGGRRIP